jgi:hypothetical protein
MNDTTKKPYSHLLLRDLPPELAEAFRDKCRADGRTQRWTAIALIQYYIDHGLPMAPKGAR